MPRGWWSVTAVSYTHLDVYKRQVLGAPWWWRECRVSVRSRWLLASIVAMGSIWAMDSAESAWRWGTLDRPSKYLLALPCVLFLLAHAPRPRWLWSVSYTHLDVYKRQAIRMPAAPVLQLAVFLARLAPWLVAACTPRKPARYLR